MTLPAETDPKVLLRIARSLQGRIPDLGQDAVARMLTGIAMGQLVVVPASTTLPRPFSTAAAAAAE